MRSLRSSHKSLAGRKDIHSFNLPDAVILGHFAGASKFVLLLALERAKQLRPCSSQEVAASSWSLNTSSHGAFFAWKQAESGCLQNKPDASRQTNLVDISRFTSIRWVQLEMLFQLSWLKRQNFQNSLSINSGIRSRACTCSRIEFFLTKYQENPTSSWNFLWSLCLRGNDTIFCDSRNVLQECISFIPCVKKKMKRTKTRIVGEFESRHASLKCRLQICLASDVHTTFRSEFPKSQRVTHKTKTLFLTCK